MRTKLLILASCLATGVGVHAQAPASPATPPAQTAVPASNQPTNCVPATPRGSTAPNDATVGQANEALGDKLAKSDGTLCPPSGVDPQIRAPTPETGNKMPVIPPPGSPGGDQNMRPK